MSKKIKTLASQFENHLLKTKEDISILFISADNKSFCINVSSLDKERTDDMLPNEISLSEKPLTNYRVIARIISPGPYSKNMFNSKCRVIANSLEDKLKSFAIIENLKNCL